MQSREHDLDAARSACEAGDFERAYLLADRHLKIHPLDPSFLTIMVYVMLATHKPTIAYPLAKLTTELIPRDAGAWLNLGMAANDLWQEGEPERYYKRALKYAREDRQKSMICVNLGSVFVDTGRFIEGEKYCKQALEYNPESVKAVANLGFCQLAQRNWKEGWKNYRKCIGSEWRPEVKFNDEPQWDGKSRGTIALVGEQGLGDEVSFASQFPDVKKWADENDSQIIVECDKRLEGLFRRTFPDIEIHGTRGAKEVFWDVRRVDYSIPVGQVGEYFRLKDEDFPGTPYLVPDPDRVLQWKALFKSKNKPVIGLGWRSGIAKTGAKYRQMDLEQLLPVLSSVDAHWVSLQYKPASKEIEAFRNRHPEIDIVEYPHGTLTQDYDDTVALIAALDGVVCMHTSANHVAGGLGIPAYVMVPKNSQWRYGTEGSDFIWAKSVKLYRQKKNHEWGEVIANLSEDLSAIYSRVPKAAGKAPRKGKLRRNGAKVRKARRPNNRQAGDQPTA